MTDVRQTVFGRSPVYRRIFAVHPRRPLPRWLRRLLLALSLLLVLFVVLVACHEERKPTSLATSRLAGTRLTTGPVCIEEAVDVSGSMSAFVPQRERAEHELFTFARRELLGTDLMSEAFFAGSAVVAMPPTSMAALGGPPGVPGGLDVSTTVLAPAIDALVAARTSSVTSCAARALVVITDGQVQDDAKVLGEALRRAHYTRLYAVVPAETGWGPPDELRGVLAPVTVYAFHDGGLSGRFASVVQDAKPLDVVFGEVLGGLTGQRLQRAEPKPSATAAGRTVRDVPAIDGGVRRDAGMRRVST